MIKWLKRFFGPIPKPQIFPVGVPQTKMRLAQWRSNQENTNAAAKVTRTPDFQMMLSVLHNEHPAFLVADAGTALQDRAVLQARAEGYTLCLANLEALAIHLPQQNMPEAEFAPEEPTE